MTIEEKYTKITLSVVRYIDTLTQENIEILEDMIINTKKVSYTYKYAYNIEKFQ